MSNYKIFDLLYSNAIEKSDADNRVFMHKYVVGKQPIKIHLLKTGEEINPDEILGFFKQVTGKI